MDGVIRSVLAAGPKRMVAAVDIMRRGLKGVDFERSGVAVAAAVQAAGLDRAHGHWRGTLPRRVRKFWAERRAPDATGRRARRDSSGRVVGGVFALIRHCSLGHATGRGEVATDADLLGSAADAAPPRWRLHVGSPVVTKRGLTHCVQPQSRTLSDPACAGCSVGQLGL